MLGNHDQVGMGNAEPVHHQSDAQGFQRLPDGTRKALRQRHDVDRQRVRNIAEVVDVLFRDQHQLAGVDRADAHEAEARLVLVDPAARGPFGDDLAEHTSWGGTVHDVIIVESLAQKERVSRFEPKDCKIIGTE